MESLLYSIPAILIALTFHEYCHGLAASMLGDDLPRLQGRLSLNPLRHLDVVGTLMLLFTHFGWAKPVMVNPNAFRGNRKRGMLLVAIAGPLANLFLALLSGFFIKIISSGLIPYNIYFLNFFIQLMVINVYLAAFNIIPLPPLDGSKVLAAILPYKYANWIYSAGQYSMIILLILSFTGFLGYLLGPITNGLFALIGLLTGMHFV